MLISIGNAAAHTEVNTGRLCTNEFEKERAFSSDLSACMYCPTVLNLSFGKWNIWPISMYLHSVATIIAIHDISQYIHISRYKSCDLPVAILAQSLLTC